MTDTAKVPSLTEKFTTAAMKLGGDGQTDSGVFQAEARNLCEKFEIFRDMAESPAEKKQLGGVFAAVTYAMASQIRMQQSVNPIDVQTGVTLKMFSTLSKLDPDSLSRFSADFQKEALILKTTASLQLHPMPREALTRGADLLDFIAYYSRPPVAPHSNPKPKQ